MEWINMVRKALKSNRIPIELCEAFSRICYHPFKYLRHAIGDQGKPWWTGTIAANTGQYVGDQINKLCLPYLHDSEGGSTGKQMNISQ